MIENTSEVEPNITPILTTRNLTINYGKTCAVDNISLDIATNKITAIFGQSGCGKSTLLRAFNRMNELSMGVQTQGEVLFSGINIYDPVIDPYELRRRIGMVFQKPNPFPKSIYENVAWGAKIHGFKGDMEEHVERCLTDAALWSEVKDKLEKSGLSLSGGQQQRLCIARALAVKPEIILFDEPTSALDPLAEVQIEDLMTELSNNYTVVLVTHKIAQASHVCDNAVFLGLRDLANPALGGMVIEVGTKDIFTTPKDPRTEAYIRGDRESFVKAYGEM